MLEEIDSCRAKPLFFSFFFFNLFLREHNMSASKRFMTDFGRVLNSLHCDLVSLSLFPLFFLSTVVLLA